jgi:predicted RNA-binding Zn-ribbon protein involved in translation (DUF1610 family)
MSEQRKFWFLWVAKCTGTPFVVEGYDVVFKCPVCGEEDAFEASHCVRINEENLLGGVRL